MRETDEGASALTFEIQLTRPVPDAVTVRYKSRDYTATEGEDYSPVVGDLSLTTSNPKAQVKVAVAGDRVVEGSEVFFLDLHVESSVANQKSCAFGVIVTDDLGPRGGKIAFDYQQPHERCQSIFIMNADGSRVTRLTPPNCVNRVPVFSNDGQRIVFESRRDGNPEIYVMNADGSQPRRITRNPAVDGYARFSPDGRRIVFFSNREGDYNVYITNADGSGEPRRLTVHDADDFDPCFSVDGKRVYFPSNRDGDLDIYVIDADGANLRRLNDTDANEHYPSASPDGQRITFRTNRDGQYEVYTMAVDGSDPKRVTRTDESERHPAFSPDGKQIVYQQFVDWGRTSLCVAGADDCSVRVLRGPSAANLNGTWAPGEVTSAGPRFEMGLVDRLNAINRRHLARRATYLLCMAAACGFAAHSFLTLRRKTTA